MVTTKEVKELRDKTGISIGECKRALEESGGDMKKALEILQGLGAAVSLKKAGRTLASGVVRAYIHSTNDIGAMVELLCETDFVARNEEFQALAYDLAMQLAALPIKTKDAFLAQTSIKDSSRSVKDLLETAIHKFGEKIELGGYSRFSISGR